MFVGHKTSTASNVHEIPNSFFRRFLSIAFASDLDFFQSDSILKTEQYRQADIIHCHNLHGYYFNLETLQKIKELDPCIEVVMVTAANEAKSAVQSIKLGAYDYITKPFEVDELLSVLKNVFEKQSLQTENRYLKTVVEEEWNEIDLVGASPAIKQIKEQIASICDVDSTVLITGETGTGKEVVAKAIHKLSRRKNKPFVSVNCAAIPENLFESELFGHERGSFTGAFERSIGKFELADEGTIFLDEIGCLPMGIQSKLLRVLENKSFERVGGNKQITSDVRIISATNSQLQEAVERRKFREDLYYRLNVINLELPPLRERKEDIKPLILFFFEKFCRELKRESPTPGRKLFDWARTYRWSGNVRELKNFVERVVVLGEDAVMKRKSFFENDFDDLPEAMTRFEVEHIKRALKHAKGNRTQAARALGLNRTTFMSRMKVFGIK